MQVKMEFGLDTLFYEYVYCANLESCFNTHFVEGCRMSLVVCSSLPHVPSSFWAHARGFRADVKFSR